MSTFVQTLESLRAFFVLTLRARDIPLSKSRGRWTLMHIIVRYVDAHGTPIDRPTPEQLERLANAYAKAIIQAKFPNATFKDAPSIRAQ